MTNETIQQTLSKCQQQSDDPDTQTACLAINLQGDSLYCANKLPDGVASTPERVNRPNKHVWIEHAERYLVALAARVGFKLEGSRVYVNWFPCSDCARVLINSGVKTLHADKLAYEARKDDPRYGFAVAMEMLSEAGVKVEWM